MDHAAQSEEGEVLGIVRTGTETILRNRSNNRKSNFLSQQVDDSRVVVGGGISSSNTVETYDIKRKTWTLGRDA